MADRLPFSLLYVYIFCGKMSELDFSNLNQEKIERLFLFFNKYSFGYGTKKDVDNEMFMTLCDLGLISQSLVDIQCKLNVTRTKAKSLIEERERRLMSKKLSDKSIEEVLKDQLKDLLDKNMFECEQGKIKFEILSPLLRDYLKEKLRENNFISDGSFSTDVVVMSTKAYVSLCHSLFQKQTQDFENALKDNGIEKRLDEILNVLIKIKDSKGEKSQEASSCANSILKWVVSGVNFLGSSASIYGFIKPLL